MATPQDDLRKPASGVTPAEAGVDMSALAALAPVGLGVATLDGRLLAANPTLASILGVDDPEQLVGLSIARFHPSPLLAADVLSERLADGRVEGLELEARGADGGELVLRIDAQLQREHDQTPVVCFAVSRVTGRDERTEAGTSQKMEAVERFAAGVAHDYNNLLTTIIGETRQLLVDLLPSTDSHESAQSVMSSAKRAAEITRRLLVFSRAEHGRPEVVDLNDSVWAAEGALKASLSLEIALVLRLDSEVGEVWIDPSHLHVILANLVGNAAEAMPTGGRAVVETSLIKAPTDTAGLDFHPPVPPGEYVSVAVGDTGRGMNPRTRRRIFDPFFTTKEPGGGAGLGLATVYGLVLRASGHLAVISAPAWGTLVRVLLPLQLEPESAELHPPRPVGAAKPTDRKDEAPRRKKILVVDDEGSVLRVISKILRRAGYVVHQASSAFEAQDEIRRLGCELDLVISDVMMPRMKGTELVAWLRRRCPEASVLLVSGYADCELVRAWVDADPASFLPKPFEPAELLDRVRERVGEPIVAT